MKQKGNPLAQFLIGLAMLVSGGYWFLSSVAVHTAFYSLRLGGMRLNGGLVVVPFIVGVIWICVNTDSFGAKLLTGAGFLMIVASVIAGTEFVFRYTSLYNYLIMLVLMFGGAALILKVLCHDPERKKKKDKEEVKSSQERSNQMMMWMMPLMYLWFGYTMPAGMCIYMAANALCTVGQEAIFNKILRKDIDKMKAEAAEREEKEKAELAARKAEIAERRRLQEEANKANKGKKKAKKPASAKKPANKNGRIGIRTYALGRDYDPDRYGGVTAYRDPQEIIDEQAVEDAYKKKRRRKADAVEQALQQAEEAGDLEAVKKLEEKQAELAEAEEAAEEAAELTDDSAAENDGAETPAGEGSIADETFAQLNAETSAEADAEAKDQSSDDNA